MHVCVHAHMRKCVENTYSLFICTLKCIDCLGLQINLLHAEVEIKKCDPPPSKF